VDAIFNFTHQITGNIFAVASTSERSREPLWMPACSTSGAVVSCLVAPGNNALAKLKSTANCNVDPGCFFSIATVSIVERPVIVFLDFNEQSVKILPQAWKLLDQLCCFLRSCFANCSLHRFDLQSLWPARGHTFPRRSHGSTPSADMQRTERAKFSILNTKKRADRQNFSPLPKLLSAPKTLRDSESATCNQII